MKRILEFVIRTLVFVCFILTVADCRKSRRYKRGNGRCSEDSLAEYSLSFFGDWSKESFPRMYPKYRPHAQWSKLYGLSHGTPYKLWSEGELASPAVKKFVEERSTLLLDRQAQGYNATYDVFTAAPIRGGLGRTSVRIFANGKHSKVSFLVKIIPSPDWFVGVNALDLCKNGRWRRKVYAHLRPMDAGTDKGLTYTSPNWPAHPQQKIFPITPTFPDHPASSFYYPQKSRLPRIAHAIFERITEYQQRGPVTDVHYNKAGNVEVKKQAHELMPRMSASELDEDEIPLNTKIDEALREKLENDIQTKLRNAPRQSKFLQNMLKEARPLADQSSEKEEKMHHLQDKATTEETMTTTPTTTKTISTTKRSLSYYQTRRDPITDEVEEDPYESNERYDSQRVDRYERRKLYTMTTMRPSTHEKREQHHDRNLRPKDTDYAAAYSMSSAEAIQATEVYENTIAQTPRPYFNRQPPIRRRYEDNEDGEVVTRQKTHTTRTRNPYTRRPSYTHKDSNPEPESRYGDRRTHYRRTNYNRYRDEDEDEDDDDDDEVVEEDLVVGRDNVEPPQRKPFQTGFEQYRPSRRRVNTGKGDEPLDCLVSEWTQWTPCSKTCGFGVKTRSRYVTQHSQNGGMNCPLLTGELLCGSMSTCKWNYFNSMFNKYKQTRRGRRRRRHHHG